MATAGENKDRSLQVWSCGGLAEAFMPANQEYEKETGCFIAYTGAFAAALGKSLLGGSGRTEVFAPRVLDLAKKLRSEGKMLHFQPLCFAKYGLVVPKGNPAGIQDIQDMAKPGVKVVLSPDASPPGGKASMVVLKKAGIEEQAKKNAVVVGDCVQTALPALLDGRGDVAVAELRMTRLPEFKGKVEWIEIPEKFMPPPPMTFTIGVMKWARDRELAENFIRFILSDKGQSCFERAGFIPAMSEEGKRLTKKYGVTDA
jgi:molybdate transport system substrate-binding protein